MWRWLFERRRPRAEATTAASDDNADDNDGDDDTADTAGAPDADPAIDPLAAPPLTDELDLHTFRPRECGDVVTEYLHAAKEAGFARVRIIHGKGIGALRRTVHAVLETHPAVTSYRLGDERSGSWGATLVELRPSPGGE